MTFNKDEVKQITDHVNNYRKEHNSKVVKHSAKISKISQAHSDNIVSTGQFKHSNNSYGENLYMSKSAKMINPNEKINYVLKAIDAWYNEYTFYNFEKNDFEPRSGHFSQLVWNNCSEFGIGVSIKENKIYVCMNFNPAGNVRNQFKENVKDKM